MQRPWCRVECVGLEQREPGGQREEGGKEGTDGVFGIHSALFFFFSIEIGKLPQERRGPEWTALILHFTDYLFPAPGPLHTRRLLSLLTRCFPLLPDHLGNPSSSIPKTPPTPEDPGRDQSCAVEAFVVALPSTESGSH